MSKTTISTTHLTNKDELCNELSWNEFKIKTPNEYILTNQDFELVAIGHPNQALERWDMEIINEKYQTQEDLIYALVIKV